MRIKGAKYFVKPGQRFGRLVVIKEFSIIKYGYPLRRVRCKCDCGNIIETNLSSIFKHTQSCGCFRRENSANMLRTHGLWYDPVYAIFVNMKSRCYNKKDKNYNRWGGRGIGICKEWLDNPKLFVDWAYSNGYKKGLTIERIDNNGDYSPDNCTFADRLRQANNTRNNRIIKYNGDELSMADFCRKYNLNYFRFGARTGRLNWSIEKSMINCGHYVPMNDTDKARSLYERDDIMY